MPRVWRATPRFPVHPQQDGCGHQKNRAGHEWGRKGDTTCLLELQGVGLGRAPPCGSDSGSGGAWAREPPGPGISDIHRHRKGCFQNYRETVPAHRFPTNAGLGAGARAGARADGSEQVLASPFMSTEGWSTTLHTSGMAGRQDMLRLKWHTSLDRPTGRRCNPKRTSSSDYLATLTGPQQNRLLFCCPRWWYAFGVHRNHN